MFITAVCVIFLIKLELLVLEGKGGKALATDHRAMK